MLDPTKCTITRSPIVVNGKITWTATMTFHVKEELDANLLDLRDFAAAEEMDNRVKARLHKMVWMAIYGDLLGPCVKLIDHAIRNCPPNYRVAMQKAVGQVITLLKLKILPNEKPDSTSGND